jgi:hypothetical protein
MLNDPYKYFENKKRCQNIGIYVQPECTGHYHHLYCRFYYQRPVWPMLVLKDKSVQKYLVIVGKITLKLILETEGVKGVNCIQNGSKCAQDGCSIQSVCIYNAVIFEPLY